MGKKSQVKVDLERLFNQLEHCVNRCGGKTTITLTDLKILKDALSAMK